MLRLFHIIVKEATGVTFLFQLSLLNVLLPHPFCLAHMMQVIATILHLTFLWRKRQQNTSRPVARFATLFFVLRKKTAHWGTGGVPGTQHVRHVLLVVH